MTNKLYNCIIYSFCMEYFMKYLLLFININYFLNNTKK